MANNIYKVETWFMGMRVAFIIEANTPEEATKIVNEKPAAELLMMLKIRDVTNSMSTSLIADYVRS